MAGHLSQGTSDEDTVYDSHDIGSGYAQRGKDDTPIFSIQKDTKEQKLGNKRSDIVGKETHDSANDPPPEEAWLKGDCKKWDTLSDSTRNDGKGGEDNDDAFSGFSDSPSTPPALERRTDRSKARTKAMSMPRAEYRKKKAKTKVERRARKNAKRYQKKKLYGPVANLGHAKENESLIPKG